MAAGLASGTNTFIPNHEATGSLISGYSRGVEKFALSRYCQYIEMKESRGYFLKYTVENAARIRTNDDSEHVWADGADAPSGVDNTESWEWKPVITTRRLYPFMLGQKAVNQATWNIVTVESQGKGQQAMTARTMLAIAKLRTALAAAPGQFSPVAGMTGGGFWHTGSNGLGTENPPFINNCLMGAAATINLASLGVIQPSDIHLIVNPNGARRMAASPEIRDYVKQSPYAMAQIRGDVPNQNGQWGLPDVLYGHPVEIEDAARVSSRKGAATAAKAYILGDNEAFFVTRIGGLEGLAESRSFSTLQMYWYNDEMTVETMEDSNNRRLQGRVVQDIGFVCPSEISGFLFQNLFA